MSQKRSQYTAEFKLSVVEYAEKHGNRAAGRYFSISETCARSWRKMKGQLQRLPPKKMAQRGQKCSFPKLEEDLVKWIHETYDNGRGTEVSRRMLCCKAREMAKEAGLEFLASVSWSYRFVGRHGIHKHLPVSFSDCITKRKTLHGRFCDKPNQQNSISCLPVHSETGDVRRSLRQKATVPYDDEDCDVESKDSDETVDPDSQESLEKECNDDDTDNSDDDGSETGIVPETEKQDPGSDHSVFLGEEVDLKTSREAEEETCIVKAGEPATPKQNVEYTCNAEKLGQDSVQVLPETLNVSDMQSLHLDLVNQSVIKDQSCTLFGGNIIYKKGENESSTYSNIFPDPLNIEESPIFVNEQDFAVLVGESKEGPSALDGVSKTGLTTKASPKKHYHPQSGSSKLTENLQQSLPEGCIRKQKKKETKIVSFQSKRSLPREHNSMYPELEKGLIEWIFDLHKREPFLKITLKMICAKANHWAEQAGIPAAQFSGSPGWVARFLFRYRHLDLPVKRNRSRKGKKSLDVEEPGFQVSVDQPDDQEPEEGINDHQDGNKVGMVQEEEVSAEGLADDIAMAALESMMQTTCDNVDKPQREQREITERSSRKTHTASNCDVASQSLQSDVNSSIFSSCGTEMDRKTETIQSDCTSDEEAAQSELQTDEVMASSPEQLGESGPSVSTYRKQRMRRRAYTAAFKLEVVDYAEKYGNRRAEREYSLPLRNLRNWRKKKAILETLPKEKKCLRGLGPHVPWLEEELLRWIILQFTERRGKLVTPKMIREQALQILKEKGTGGNFTASRSWVQRFLLRHKDYDLPVRRSQLHKKTTKTEGGSGQSSETHYTNL